MEYNHINGEVIMLRSTITDASTSTETFQMTSLTNLKDDDATDYLASVSVGLFALPAPISAPRVGNWTLKTVPYENLVFIFQSSYSRRIALVHSKTE